MMTTSKESQCTYRCVVLPDAQYAPLEAFAFESQCTYRCVVLPDAQYAPLEAFAFESQCTYRCVVLPDGRLYGRSRPSVPCLNAPTGAWCSLTQVHT